MEAEAADVRMLLAPLDLTQTASKKQHQGVLS